MSVIDTLITDRPAPTKYDWQDFNRINDAMEYIRQRFADRGYLIPGYEVPTHTWVRSDIPTIAQLQRHIDNVHAVRAVLRTDSALPASMRRLTTEGANQIERMLTLVDDEITRMTAIWNYSGELFAGEV